ncbi:hypothetical protein QJQ45_014287 [Haematococcus lacustris]|nr:hypothetical protein QJQ45_014287 [Haematococcus lacustris]
MKITNPMLGTPESQQVEHAFNPKRLQNWEVPKEDVKSLAATTNGSRFGNLQPRSGTTGFISDDKGYLKDGVTKITNAFTTKLEVHQKTPPRWPTENTSIPLTQRATMGYKGIQTSYLPTSTVPIKTSEVKGTKEALYY